jgi:hypothetical protein
LMSIATANEWRGRGWMGGKAPATRTAAAPPATSVLIGALLGRGPSPRGASNGIGGPCIGATLPRGPAGDGGTDTAGLLLWLFPSGSGGGTGGGCCPSSLIVFTIVDSLAPRVTVHAPVADRTAVPRASTFGFGGVD